MKHMRMWSLGALLLTACAIAGEPGEAEIPSERAALLGGPIGSNHPASGQWSPVGESTWATATWALGSRFTAGEGSTLRVAVYSAHATKVVLEIYGQATGADALYDYDMKKGSDQIWRAAVALAPGKTIYAFRAWGPTWPFSASWNRGNSAVGFASDVDASGNRFNPNKVLCDPYASELTADLTSAALTAAGENNGMFGTGGTDVAAGHTYSGPITGNVAINRRNVDTGRYAIKSVAFVDATSFGAKPNLAAKDAVIYEAHPRGLTAHPSSVRLTTILSGMAFPHAVNVPTALRGTYAGAGYMAGYLKDLGYTAVELLPVQETDNDTNPTTTSGGNYWGYMTYGFFAPDRHYASDKTLGGPTREFKQMVAAFHAAGLEVYLDVVYNHTGEGGTWDATHKAAQVVGFRGLDNAAYYALVATDKSAYWETTGCGNNFDASQAVVRNLIKDSLTYWATQMGVDGFRFDLAPVLGRDAAPSYNFNASAQLLLDIASQASSGSYEVMAEAWDTQFPGGYQVGSFPNGWGEWNGRYRDAIRGYITGSTAGSGGVGWADAFYGDFSHYNDQGGPQRSVNLIDAHDGFTLVDLVSYGAKTNASRAWPFGPSDGGNDSNLSSDWGGNQTLRRQVIRNFEAFQTFSRGIPLAVWGDELGRTVNGNNNPYNVDSVATWTNYDMIASATPDSVATGDTSGGSEVYHNNLGTFAGGKNQNFLFVQCVLLHRKGHVALRQASYTMPVTFTRPDGSAGFNQNTDTAGRITMSGTAVGDSDFLVLTNMGASSTTFTLPAAPAGTSWVRIVDTDAWAESAHNCWTSAAGSMVSGSYGVNPRSIVVLQSANRVPDAGLRVVLKANASAENVKLPGDHNSWNINTTQTLSPAAHTTQTLDIPNAVLTSTLAQGASTTALELQVVNAGSGWEGAWALGGWTKVGCTVPDGKQITIAATDQDAVTLTIDTTTNTLTAVVEAR